MDEIVYTIERILGRPDGKHPNIPHHFRLTLTRNGHTLEIYHSSPHGLKPTVEQALYLAVSDCYLAYHTPRHRFVDEFFPNNYTAGNVVYDNLLGNTETLIKMFPEQDFHGIWETYVINY